MAKTELATKRGRLKELGELATFVKTLRGENPSVDRLEVLVAIQDWVNERLDLL